MNIIKKRELKRFYFRLFSSYKSFFLIRNVSLSVSYFKDFRSEFGILNSKILVVENNVMRFLFKNIRYENLRNCISKGIFLIFFNNVFFASKFLTKFCVRIQQNFEFISGIILNKKLDKLQVIQLSNLYIRNKIKIKTICCFAFFIAKVTQILKVSYFNMMLLISGYSKLKKL